MMKVHALIDTLRHGTGHKNIRVSLAVLLAFGVGVLAAPTARADGGTEACCIGESICQDLDPLTCPIAGGNTLGPGTVCSPQPSQACLVPQSGTCSDTVFPDCCVALSGTLGGPGTTCADVTGACCDDSAGQCFDGMPVAACGPPEGCDGCRYGGDGSTCATLDAPCGASCTSDLPGNCQSPATNPVLLAGDDRLHGGAYRIADDFIMQDSRLAQLCWFPAFMNPSNPFEDCADPGPTPLVQWDIRFYEDAGGLPGDLLHEIITSTVTSQERIDGGPVWRFSISFVPSLFGFNPGQRYWLEISGEDLDGGCKIFWASSNDGNGYSLGEADGELTSWSIEDRNRGLQDFAFCLDSGLSVPGPQLGSCCSCDGICLDNVLPENCSGIGQWALANCATVGCGGGPPPGDQCTNPVTVSEGSRLYSTHCSDTDGQIDMAGQCDFGGAQFYSDVWFKYEAPCSGRFAINLCGDSDYDGILAVYQNPDGSCPSAAQCPPTNALLVPGGCVNALCFPPSFDTDVTTGDCFLIRIGGEGTPDAVGRGRLRIDCDGPQCLVASQPKSAEILTGEGLTVPLRTMRMIGVRASSADVGRSQAMRVTATGLAPPFDVWNGLSMWVGPTVEYSELPGRGFVTPGAIGSEPTLLSAPLQCTPFFADWTVLGDEIIWIRGEFIVPSVIQPGGGGLSASSNYAVQLVDQGCSLANEDGFGLAMDITSAGWGDIGALSAGEARAVNDGVGVEEFLFILQKFGGLGGSGGLPIKARTDMLGVFAGPSPTLDGVISVSEIAAVVAAFASSDYPFVPSAATLCP